MAVLPANIKSVYNNPEKVQVIEMGTIPDFDQEDYDLTDTKDKNKFIGDVEKMCRNSREYRRLIGYIREYMSMNECSFFSNVNNIDTTAIKIHIHHSPMTLYEIVVSVINKRTFYNESLNVEDVAAEVLYLHYCLVIGLIPLSETVHDLVHNEYLFVPNDKVMGNYQDFIDTYRPWLPEGAEDKYKQLEDYTKSYNEEDNMNPLRTRYIYYDVSGAYNLPKMEDISAMLQSKMDEAKANNFAIAMPIATLMDPDDNRQQNTMYIPEGYSTKYNEAEIVATPIATLMYDDTY